MVFLFSLINISFTLFFFLFQQYLESVLFGVLSVIFIIYFSKILSFFIEKEEDPQENMHRNDIKAKKIPLKNIIEYIKKGSYYASFLFFYLSLYGFVYGINLIYNFSNFSEIFYFITFFISLSVTIIFFSFLQKKHETIFLIFRSNCIIFSIIYSSILLFFLWNNIIPSTIFVVNSLFPVITIVSVLLFDSFFKEKSKYIYILFLFYIFLIGIYYTSLIFSSVPLWHIVLGIISFFMVAYTFFFPLLSSFRKYTSISQTIGRYMGYILALSIIFSILFE